MRLLDRGDALELFCYVVFTHENKRIDENPTKNFEHPDYSSFKGMRYTDSKFLQNAFDKYKVPKLTEDINKDIFKKKTSRTFYNFTNKVRFAPLVAISESEIKKFYDYLHSHNYIKSELIDKLKVSINEKGMRKSPFTISHKQYDYENTKWWIYYTPGGTENKGIVKALLSYDFFGKATIFDFNIRSGKHEIYRGNFEIFQDVYLRLKLSLAPQNLKDLNIRIYIGNRQNVDFCLGQYYDIDGLIYAGNIILKKVTNVSENESLRSEKVIFEKVKFFNFNDTENEICEPIQTYFRNHCSYIYIADIITDENNLNSGNT